MRFTFVLTFILSVVGAAFCFSILILPVSPIHLKSSVYEHSPISIPKIRSHEEARRDFLAARSRTALFKQIRDDRSRAANLKHGQPTPLSTVVGFYVNWDPASYISLRQHIESLTYVMPEWLYLTPDGKSFKSRYTERDAHDADVLALTQTHGVPIIPTLHNLDQGKWDWNRLRALLSNPNAQERLAVKLRNYLLNPPRPKQKLNLPGMKNNAHFAGINIDFEPSYYGEDPKEAAEAHRLMHDALPKFIETLRRVFQPAHLLVTEDLPASNDDFDYRALGAVNDFVIVMLYDQHVVTGNPGPIASQQWVEDTAGEIFKQIDASKVVLGLSNYCYDWPINHDAKGSILKDENGNITPAGNGQSFFLGQMLRAADEADAEIVMDDDLNPYFCYVDDHNRNHIVYMLDAVTAYNQIQALKGYEPRGAALWRLGSEDPSIWKFFAEGKLGKPVELSQLENVKYGAEVADDIEGQGEIMYLESMPRQGKRRLATNEDGLIDSEKYTQYPSEFIIKRYGNPKKEVALTFDDGPDPANTPRILKVLKQYGAPATFFVIGKSAEQYHDIVKDCWDSGCEIGNHTFTHPHIAQVSRLRAELELNATQRAIERITGHSTKLFRPPFGEGADTNPGADDIALLQEAQDLGYVTVGMNIDPADFEKPGVDTIVSRVDHELNQGHVILLHDGGGDREQTIKALPKIIRDLKSKGYTFVTVSGLLSRNERSQMFPPASNKQETIAGLDWIVFESGFIFNDLIRILFLVSIILGLLRICIVTPLALLQSRRSGSRAVTDYAPPVTVIVPAHNEEKVVARTIHSVLDSDYPELHIIVVDDGSTDNTASVVEESFSSDPRVTFIRKENGGKSSALNLGISRSETEIIVCLDADTIFARDTISRLVPHFADPKVGAVAGNVKVGNRNNMLTIWQSVEYITSQNFDRRAYAILNSVAVVPGAVGAWRRSAVLEAGGYETDTLAEDTDLTFRIRLLGYHVDTENSALGYTEAPDTVSSLAKQRFRWAFGTLQSLWKHRRAMLRREHGAFGMFVIPAMWIYNIGFQAFSPVVDIVVLLSILHGDYAAVLTYYAAFFVVDFLGSFVAIKLDGEDTRQLSWLFWQRFFYRQFMYYVILKSLIYALKGGVVGWGKLQRKATVAIASAVSDPPAPEGRG